MLVQPRSLTRRSRVDLIDPAPELIYLKDAALYVRASGTPLLVLIVIAPPRPAS
jgi:hypothetical protein